MRLILVSRQATCLFGRVSQYHIGRQDLVYRMIRLLACQWVLCVIVCIVGAQVAM